MIRTTGVLPTVSRMFWNFAMSSSAVGNVGNAVIAGHVRSQSQAAPLPMWAQRCDLCLVLLEECRQIVGEEVADLGKLDIRGRIFGQYFRIEGIVALFGKHGRDAFAPDFLHGGQDAQFVVDQ